MMAAKIKQQRLLLIFQSSADCFNVSYLFGCQRRRICRWTNTFTFI